MPKIGIITANYVYAINDYQPAPWSQLLEMHAERFGPQQFEAMLARIQALGAGYVEWWVGTTGNCLTDPLWAGMGAEQVKALFAKHSLQIASFCPGGTGLHDDIEASCAFAAAIGAPLITGWLGREPELWERVAAALDKYDKVYGIEPHGPTYSLNSPEELKQALAVSERIGVCPDTGVWAVQDIDPLQALEQVVERVVHTHLKGYDRAQKLWCGPFEGDIRLDDCVRLLRDNNYQGVYSLEFEAEYDPDPALKQGVAMLSSILSE